MIFLFRSHRDFHNELFTAVTYPRFYLICNFFLGPLSVGVLPLPVSLGSPFTPPTVMTTYKRQDPQPVLPTIRVYVCYHLYFVHSRTEYCRLTRSRASRNSSSASPYNRASTSVSPSMSARSVVVILSESPCRLTPWSTTCDATPPPPPAPQSHTGGTRRSTYTAIRHVDAENSGISPTTSNWVRRPAVVISAGQ